MIGNIISQIIAHKAGIAIGGAIIGVAVTAVLATKDKEKHYVNTETAIADKDMELGDEEIVQMLKDQEYTPEDIEDFEENNELPEDFEYLNRKERFIIFAKSYWRTGLAMLVTIGLMVFSHVSMIKEMAAVSAALGVLGTKYKDLQEYLKKNYPEQYKEIMRKLDRKNARKKISEEGLKKEETYDGRKRYYFPKSDQIVYMKPEDFVAIQGFMSRTIGTNMELHLNEILDYIHYDLNYKDVHLSDVDYVWAFPKDSISEADYPQILEPEFDDVLDEDTKSYVVCQVVQVSYEPEVVLNKTA